MVNKKDDTKELENLGKGILSSLKDINDIEETSKPINKEMSKQVKEEKTKKQKKNFMLTDTAVNQLFELKFKYRKKDYSQIVEDAIAEYYAKYI